MKAVERAIGRWLHRVLIGHPPAHAELLNQYRASEDFARRFPRTACGQLLPDGPLRTKYTRHQADEERHEALYAQRVAALGGQPRPVGEGRDYLLAVWRAATAAGVGIPYARFGQKKPLGEIERLRLFALQVAVEERGLVEMALHRAACEAAGDAATAELMAAIEPDERFHAAYSGKAVEEAAAEVVSRGVVGRRAGPMTEAEQEVAARALAAAALSTARRIEDRAYRAVTAAFMRDLLAGPLAGSGRVRKNAIAALAWTMDSGERAAPDVGGAW